MFDDGDTPDTPEYRPGVDVATFYGCRGRNNKNSFNDTSGTWACRKNSSYLHLHFIGAVKKCKILPDGVPALTRRICHVTGSTSNNMLNIHGVTQKCSSVEQQLRNAVRVCYQESKGNKKIYTIYTCKFRGAASFAETLISDRGCTVFGLIPKNARKPIGIIKTCRTFENFILLGRTNCSNSSSFVRITIGKTKPTNCKDGEKKETTPWTLCRTIRFFNRDTNVKTNTPPCKIYDQAERREATYLCAGKHTFDAQRTLRNVSFLCRTYTTSDWKTQHICRHLLSSPAITFKFGRVNGGKPLTNFIIRTSGRMEGRFSQ